MTSCANSKYPILQQSLEFKSCQFTQQDFIIKLLTLELFINQQGDEVQNIQLQTLILYFMLLLMSECNLLYQILFIDFKQYIISHIIFQQLRSLINQAFFILPLINDSTQIHQQINLQRMDKFRIPNILSLKLLNLQSRKNLLAHNWNSEFNQLKSFIYWKSCNKCYPSYDMKAVPFIKSIKDRLFTECQCSQVKMGNNYDNVQRMKTDDLQFFIQGLIQLLLSFLVFTRVSNSVDILVTNYFQATSYWIKERVIQFFVKLEFLFLFFIRGVLFYSIRTTVLILVEYMIQSVKYVLKFQDYKIIANQTLNKFSSIHLYQMGNFYKNVIFCQNYEKLKIIKGQQIKFINCKENSQQSLFLSGSSSQRSF
ncbi:hypothetical protein pb186bvf_021163 [Paramecium bursaria]